MHDVERHWLAQRIRAPKQLLDEPRADALSPKFPKEVKLPQVHVVNKIGYLNPTNWVVPNANDFRRRKFIALAELQHDPRAVPLADL
jgi:hypothetical protein